MLFHLLRILSLVKSRQFSALRLAEEAWEASILPLNYAHNSISRVMLRAACIVEHRRLSERSGPRSFGFNNVCRTNLRTTPSQAVRCNGSPCAAPTDGKS